MTQTQWRSWGHLTSRALRPTQARGVRGHAPPGKILIFEVWNGHFLRFQGEIHAKRATKKRVITDKRKMFSF
jgi:hypothetical protein